MPAARAGPRCAYVGHMEPIEFSRWEKALVVAACVPFLMMGLLYLFA